MQKIFDEIQANGLISELEDLFTGRDYLQVVHQGTIKPDDTVLMFSIDSAQLYEMKQSDVWIYIYMVFDLSPCLRYKKAAILPGGIIPGPNPPKNVDSFLFHGLQHLAALQKEGFPVWDAKQDKIVMNRLFLMFAAADGPGLAHING
ncbi:hypothetical protein, partial [Proteus mirabilis]|uniref:hypothetical protein n=1 Tax=Proteus mirabilis TaxID=584 RepID=UPI00186A246C